MLSVLNWFPLVAAFSAPGAALWPAPRACCEPSAAPHRAGRACLLADSPSDDDWLEEEPVVLLDEKNEKTISCYVAGNIENGGVIYGALYPADAPVSLASMEGGKLMPLEADKEEAAFALAKAACAALTPPVELIDSAVVLTAIGDWMGMDVDDEDEPDEVDGDFEDEDEEVLVVTSFDGPSGEEIFLVRTLDPLYVIGKSNSETAYTVPSDAELDAVGPLIEKLVEEVEQAFDAEEDL